MSGLESTLFLGRTIIVWSFRWTPPSLRSVSSVNTTGIKEDEDDTSFLKVCADENTITLSLYPAVAKSPTSKIQDKNAMASILESAQTISGEEGSFSIQDFTVALWFSTEGSKMAVTQHDTQDVVKSVW
jgi:hypothetical protein